MRRATMIPDRSTFEAMYAGQAPWDIGKPQKPFIDVAEHITGSVLDAGCGTGDTALFLAGRGCKVPGIDFLEVPIQRPSRRPLTEACRPPSWSRTLRR
jgi:2-polyprenyl-3-methyl-5-hydroxy-6-metoxy-1,4-benzoquinol methylase